MEANSKANWSLGLPRKLAKGLTQGHDNSKALIALGLESLGQMAFMRAEFCRGWVGSPRQSSAWLRPVQSRYFE